MKIINSYKVAHNYSKSRKFITRYYLLVYPIQNNALFTKRGGGEMVFSLANYQLKK